MKKQQITRKCSFDSAHRVMNEKMKCFNIHGHTYIAEVSYEFSSIEEIGYAIDFKEIKRIGMQWIDDLLDHGVILNPKDTVFIKTAQELESKLWLMSLNGRYNYCNPSVENIAKEVLLAQVILFEAWSPNLRPVEVKLWETPNCWTTVHIDHISDNEIANFNESNYSLISAYAAKKGVVEYDDRKS